MPTRWVWTGSSSGRRIRTQSARRPRFLDVGTVAGATRTPRLRAPLILGRADRATSGAGAVPLRMPAAIRSSPAPSPRSQAPGPSSGSSNRASPTSPTSPEHSSRLVGGARREHAVVVVLGPPHPCGFRPRAAVPMDGPGRALAAVAHLGVGLALSVAHISAVRPLYWHTITVPALPYLPPSAQKRLATRSVRSKCSSAVTSSWM